MYALLANFDENVNTAIRNLWQGLEDEGITDYASSVEDREPHITIASYKNLPFTEYTKAMDAYFSSVHSFPITFQSLGIFSNTDIVYAAPTVTSRLLDFHRSYHDAFTTFNDDYDSLYLPEKWIPHSTMANHIGKDKVPDVMEYLLKEMKPFTGSISSISLLETEFEENRCVLAKVVHRTALL